MFARITVTTLAAVAALGFVANAHAGSVQRSADSDTASVTLHLADLNLNGEAGARAALGRIHLAARAICGDPPNIMALARTEQYRACMDVTVDRAVASLDNPIVTALNAGPGGPSPVLAASR